LIVVASELGIPRTAPKPRSGANGESAIVRAYRRSASAELGSVIVDSTDDADAAEATAAGAVSKRVNVSGRGDDDPSLIEPVEAIADG
jgi:hypothetical protein